MSNPRLTLTLTLTFCLIAAIILGKTVFIEGTFRPNAQILNLSRLLTPTSIPTRPVTRTTFSPSLQPTIPTKETLVSCLARKRFTMYGTEECPSCKQQRNYFGESFSSVPHVDCDKEVNLCKKKNIRSYPTWEDANGVQYRGAIPLDTLAELADCPNL